MPLAGKVALIILLLSGGGSPKENNYSQYLQAKRMQEFWGSKQGLELTVLFGSGLTPETLHQVSPDVLKKDPPNFEPQFIRGEIPGNRPAGLTHVQAYFESLGKREWRPGDRLLLFVTGHGMPNDWDPTAIRITKDQEVEKSFENNCIVLWLPGSEIYPEKSCLSVSELKELLKRHVPGEVPVRYVMSQCYSGAFHELAYHKDGEGLPHRDGDICGFTAATRDAISAGCNPFVAEELYDGYERRIAEAITGRAVFDGRPLREPTSNLSDAHDEAMRLDEAQDVPLRSSESYILDYWQAKGGKTSFNSDLNRVWKNLAEGRFPLLLKLPIEVQGDLKRRLGLIDQLKIQLGTWHPQHRFALREPGLSQISEQRKAIQEMTRTLESERENLRKELKGKRRPIAASYILSLKKGQDEPKKEWLEFETLADLDQKVVYSRLQENDLTLGKFGRYLNFYQNYNELLVEQVRKLDLNVKEEELAMVAALDEMAETSDREVARLEAFEGQLRRLETQMTVAAVVGWMAEKFEIRALSDLAGLISCELESRTF